MKAFLVLGMRLAVALCLFIGGVVAGAYLLREPEPHHFAHLDQPLWTSVPVVVQAGGKQYDRLPALVAGADVPASDLPADAVLKGQVAVAVSSEPAIPEPVRVEQAAAQMTTADPHADWCTTRYKSYRVQDDSYQPYDGGPRRLCQSPAG